MRASALARSNIALVKYWGKRDATLNLPAAGSISMTLDGLETRTTVEFGPWERDTVFINDEALEGKGLAKISKFLDLVRPGTLCADVRSTNSFPTAAGLASSASGFAALALAASQAAGLELTPQELSVLARRGSGSAARSIVGGFAIWHEGQKSDGTDSFAEELAPADHWDLRCVVLVTRKGPKDVPSTEGMNHTMETSPFYAEWLNTVRRDMDGAKEAIVQKDFVRLAEVSEGSCLAMHASAMAARPAVIYWNARTLELIHEVRSLRAQGKACFFTIDAGPHVKVFTTAEDVYGVKAYFQDHPSVEDLLVAKPGQGAELL